MVNKDMLDFIEMTNLKRITMVVAILNCYFCSKIWRLNFKGVIKGKPQKLKLETSNQEMLFVNNKRLIDH